VGIGILLGEMPRMLHDVIGSLIGVEPDLCVLADDVEAGALVQRVARERPDVVVLCSPSVSPPPVCEELLGRFPGLTVVTLEERGQQASIYMMRPMRIRVAEISRVGLVTAIRRAAGPLPFPSRVYDARASAAAGATAERSQREEAGR
jgi:hypothetical protein